MKTVEDIFGILIDGSKSQMDDLAESGASYRYSPDCGAFTVVFEREEMRAHKVFNPPACVAVFGNSHTF